jgi:hypothetical protein
MRTLTDVKNGTVSENDLSALINFCAISLFAQNKISEKVWNTCIKEAEIAALAHGQIEELN